MDTIVAKHKIKDSVFTNLFRDKKYLLMLYKSLHPEDNEITEEDLREVTLENVLVDDLYNDLGFSVKDRLIILVEAQSTWTVNIVIRALLYMAYTYKNYFESTMQNLYKSRAVKVPTPELYVIYSGERGSKPDTISLSETFFGGTHTDIEVKVRVIYADDTEGIINQYIVFSKVYDEQRKIHGRTLEAVAETIRICKESDVLREYLEGREKEVTTIMTSLFDEEQIMRVYVESERREAAEQTAELEKRETVLRMLRMGKLSDDEIALCAGVSVAKVKEIKAEAESCK